MQGSFQSVSYDTNPISPTYGQIIVILNNCDINAQFNQVIQFDTPNVLSMPVTGQLVNIDKEANTQFQVTGYVNSIQDVNYTIGTGEYTAYSSNWYSSVRTAGVEIQEANTANIENVMMGQSTNEVLLDIMQLLIDFITWASIHDHSGVQTGSGVSGPPVTSPPSDSTVVSDQTYINGNENLAITGVYTPR
jgi:hypothetical protein